MQYIRVLNGILRVIVLAEVVVTAVMLVFILVLPIVVQFAKMRMRVVLVTAATAGGQYLMAVGGRNLAVLQDHVVIQTRGGVVPFPAVEGYNTMTVGLPKPAILITVLNQRLLVVPLIPQMPPRLLL